MEKRFTTTSGINIREVYTEPRPMTELPGEFPYTRGIQKDMYRGRLWTMRQYAGFSTPEESNKRYHYLLAQGTTGLSVAFDLPTQIGYDSDHPMAEGEVGKVGVPIDSLRDMEILFEGISLRDITTSMTINATASILLAMYVAVARKQGADISEISGTVQNDILKEYAARGTYIYPPKPSMRLITDLFEFCSENMPKWNIISVSGYHIREAGSTAVQELAFTLSNGKSYVKAAAEKGLDINIFGKRISFFFNCHNNFFEEIAKFRAARRMWAKITTEFGATDPSAQKLRFHTQTGGSTLTAQQPLNNVIRVSNQAMAAVLGGTQSLHTNGYDEALSLPGEAAAKIALRTQQIIAFESGAADTVDPLAGSYFIEALTDEVEKAAWEYIERIDGMGGSVSAIESGYIQQEIADAAFAYQAEIERGERVVVGVNKYTDAATIAAELPAVDDSIRMVQSEKISKVRAGRNEELLKASLAGLNAAARNNGKLFPEILKCVEAYATVGEISDEMRAVFGEY